MPIKFHKDETMPQNGEVFVFGSNRSGRHGKGSALIAKQLFGARYGIGEGYMTKGTFGGHSYAIPTKDQYLKVLSLNDIRWYVERFKTAIVGSLSDKEFFITSIGCGLAGYNPSDIAPMFMGINDRCSFPDTWKPWLDIW